MLICPLYIFFDNVSPHVFGPFFKNQVVNFFEFQSSACILDNFFSAISFIIIFSKFVAYLLILLTFSFTKQVLHFNEVHLINYLFNGQCIGFVSNPRSYPRSVRLSVIFQEYYYSFIFLYKHKSTNHFELFFCERCKVCVQLHFFPGGHPDVPASFVKKAIFAPLYYLCSFVKNQLYYFGIKVMLGLLLIFLLCSTGPFVLFLINTTLS